MRFQEATFVKRYKRFFADVILNGQPMVAHVPNTGSLKSCLMEGAPCLVSASDRPERKLKATLEFIKTPTSWVGVNTTRPNVLVFEAWRQKLIPEWIAFGAGQREYKISPRSRLDLVLAPHEAALTLRQDLHHIEIKNVTYAEDGVALFPDAVTTRGQKHLEDLMTLKSQGFGAEMIFIVQRQDCTRFAPADHIDPQYGRLLRLAKEKGVMVRAFACHMDPSSGLSLHPTPLALTF